ncbi:MAG: DUF2281 domain-containing protein [Leptolyngbyaceae cyanobacterium SU_3_3]|nr:DUF2281 domain-containing protein [Leptolyngbyaceae cyanobacterium SU_3_3]
MYHLLHKLRKIPNGSSKQQQQLINQWRQLPTEKQQEVIDFVTFLAQRSAKTQISTEPPSRDQFQQLRDQIIASGIPLLSDREIEQEVADRRGGYNVRTITEAIAPALGMPSPHQTVPLV